jgi:hypothetical protein
MNTSFLLYIYSLCISSPRLSLVRGSLYPRRAIQVRSSDCAPTPHAKKALIGFLSLVFAPTKKPNRSPSTPHPSSPRTHRGTRHRRLHALPHYRLIHPPPSAAPSQPTPLWRALTVTVRSLPPWHQEWYRALSSRRGQGVGGGRGVASHVPWQRGPRPPRSR